MAERGRWWSGEAMRVLPDATRRPYSELPVTDERPVGNMQPQTETDLIDHQGPGGGLMVPWVMGPFWRREIWLLQRCRLRGPGLSDHRRPSP